MNPLRHYAEVHLLMEPAPAGSGLEFVADCPVDVLGKNWQHQVMANLAAKEQLGVLTGSPLTDVKITLINGRASNVHTVGGGDFREATWRAVRQGLMLLKQRNVCQLLEPWYQFRLEIGSDQVGRALNDIQKMNGTFEAPTNAGNAEMVTIVGTAPVSEMQEYSQDVNAYTHGQGQLECVFAGYQPCHNAAEVVANTDYDPVADVANTPGFRLLRPRCWLSSKMGQGTSDGACGIFTIKNTSNDLAKKIIAGVFICMTEPIAIFLGLQSGLVRSNAKRRK